MIAMSVAKSRSSGMGGGGCMNHILIMLDNRRSRQDIVGGPKGPGPVQDYRQTDG